jgi:transcription elongation factor Elf1
MISYFKWTCPDCNHIHEAEEVNAELGPFLSVVCDECGATIEETRLTVEDLQPWINAINKLITA